MIGNTQGGPAANDEQSAGEWDWLADIVGEVDEDFEAAALEQPDMPEVPALDCFG